MGRKYKEKSAWMMLGVLAVAECLAMSLWMTASAVTGQMAELWALTSFQSGLLTTSVQIGFVAGAAGFALSNVGDLFENRRLFAICAVAAAVSNGMLVFCDGFGAALVCRFLTGMFLAGVYPPGMKMAATWFVRYRGLAIGTLVGALTLGKALPYLLKTIGDENWQAVVLMSSAGAILAAILILTVYKSGPNKFARKSFTLKLVFEVWNHRPTRLAILGYMGHMWELYAMWTWAPIFLAAVAEHQGVNNSTFLNMMAFATIGVGAVGCVAGGLMADKMGREKIVTGSMLVSGICCVTAGLMMNVPIGLVSILLLVWGAFVVADSAQFSAMVTEVTPAHAVGTALLLQTCLGFLLTTVSIQIVPVLVDRIGWQYAFAVLSIGPFLGVEAIRRFGKTCNAGECCGG